MIEMTKEFRRLLNKVGDDVDNDLVVELMLWLEDRVNSNPRLAAAALATGLGSLLSQTSNSLEQAQAVTKVYANYIYQTASAMKEHELKMEQPNNDN